MSSFLLRQAVIDVISKLKLEYKDLILLDKVNLPEELLLAGKADNFKQIFQQIIMKALLAYSKNCLNKIILVSSKFESDWEISLNVTDGGSLFKSKLLRERAAEPELAGLAKQIKNHLMGKIQIITKHNHGKTLKCLFPLSR